ncbi:protein translocase subunit SecD [Kaistia dalseonensis]|uniref:Protein translocase subunit SecD n=1 Tax=Kaistia dalseonensis TaxID=410840 RepID=A0ABU0H290_9HYPH|nr:protein translocase subunit SecD [Kaistia dalseonensis]MCX5493606.1 protein translocase subunit SecD [Kaistia dalseonensis]MDQ0436167.1 preprotein translocase subunit SecD/SecD/SecF fusion protein [Kaistia dalseonensis]
MLHFTRWKMIAILGTVLVGILLALPNLFSKETVDSWPSWVPKRQMVLGLDLQGGAYLLYEVDKQDYVQKRLRTLVGEIRKAMLEEPRIGYSGLGVQGQGVQLRIRDLTQLDEVRKRLDPLRNPLTNSVLGGTAINEFDLNVGSDGLVQMTYTDAGLAQRVRSIVDQSIEVIARRVDQLGTVEPSIQRQGEDRILVEAPGLGDPERLKSLVGQTAQLTFHLVDSTLPPGQTDQTRKPGTIVVPAVEAGGPSYVLEEAPLLTGEDLTDAQATFDQRSNEPVVSFRLTTGGARTFGDVTQKNVNRAFAIVLDDKVISAPVIREPILGGSGQISGSFSIQSANDLAILLRAGSLPAKLTIVEERSIGPGLGADSIRAGKIASIIATVAVCAFMVATYGVLGWIANIAVIVNVILIFSIVTILGATLSLPGIAGVIITVGTAVDSNVLIYERIREEYRQGRSAIASIDAGFHRALGTILDANVTTLIAAIVLFYLGSGPIRGFAVTHAIGVATTMFTAFTFTRLLVAMWVRWRRPTKITL